MGLFLAWRFGICQLSRNMFTFIIPYIINVVVHPFNKQHFILFFFHLFCNKFLRVFFFRYGQRNCSFIYELEIFYLNVLSRKIGKGKKSEFVSWLTEIFNIWKVVKTRWCLKLDQKKRESKASLKQNFSLMDLSVYEEHRTRRSWLKSKKLQTRRSEACQKLCVLYRNKNLQLNRRKLVIVAAAICEHCLNLDLWKELIVEFVCQFEVKVMMTEEPENPLTTHGLIILERSCRKE